MANRFVLPGQQVVDANGNPYSGAKLYYYVSGTSTPQDTYSDNALTTPNANPVVADSAGRFSNIFLGASAYKVILKTSADVTVATWDPVQGPEGATEATQAEADARTADDVFLSPRRLAEGLGLQGSSIASAAALTLPAVGDSFTVTGSTGPIGTISTRVAGRRITLRFTGAPTITHSANIILPGGGSRTVSDGSVLQFESQGSGVWRLIDGLGVLPRGHIAGLTLSNNGTDATNDIDIAAGECVDSTGTRLIQIAASVTRQLDVAFGTGNGGLSSSLTIANTTYHVFAIIKSDGSASIAFDTSVTAATLITDHSITHYRRIGSIIRASAAILGVKQNGDKFLLDSHATDRNSTSVVAWSLISLTVPNGLNVEPILSGFQVSSTNGDNFTQIADGRQPATPTSLIQLAETLVAGEAAMWNVSGGLFTDTSRRIYINVSAAGSLTSNILRTRGWIDRRGRDE